MTLKHFHTWSPQKSQKYQPYCIKNNHFNTWSPHKSPKYQLYCIKIWHFHTWCHPTKQTLLTRFLRGSYAVLTRLLRGSCAAAPQQPWINKNKLKPSKIIRRQQYSPKIDAKRQKSTKINKMNYEPARVKYYIILYHIILHYITLYYKRGVCWRRQAQGRSSRGLPKTGLYYIILLFTTRPMKY